MHVLMAKRLINEVKSLGLSHKSLVIDAWIIVLGVPVSLLGGKKKKSVLGCLGHKSKP